MNRNCTFCVCLFSQIVICERWVGLVSFKTNVSETAGQIHLNDIMCDVMGHIHWIDNVRCKMHQARLHVKRTSRLHLKCNWNLSENKTRLKRKIANAKIYEDKRDLYCIEFLLIFMIGYFSGFKITTVWFCSMIYITKLGWVADHNVLWYYIEFCVSGYVFIYQPKEKDLLTSQARPLHITTSSPTPNVSNCFIIYYQIKYWHTYSYNFAPNSPNLYKEYPVYKIIPVVINNVITFQVDIKICEMLATKVIWTDHHILK